MILQHLDKNNLHHAYLIEGIENEILPELFKYFENLGIKIFNNPDFYHTSIDFLKIKEALDLRAMGNEKGFNSDKKIFIININRFSPDAQGVLLKMFEEPIENTHFFIITPDVNVLTKTLISRFYLIKSQNFSLELTEAQKFISLNLRDRIDFIKEFINAEKNEEDDDEVGTTEPNSIKTKVFSFLNALECVLHQKFLLREIKNNKVDFFEQIFKVREYLRMQSSPTKTLLESVALSIPKL